MRQAGIRVLLASVVLVIAGGWTGLVAASPRANVTTSFTNPVYRHNFPDPFLLKAGDTWYAYGTGTCSLNLQVISSHDLVHWSAAGDALPQPPSWADTRCVPFFQNRMMWAPEVLQRSDGSFVLYYAAHWAAADTQCISYAVSANPQGPFVDSSTAPFVCQRDQGGSIDPDIFRDADGSLFLLWKNDGNCCGFPVYIWSQPLSADGTALMGQPAKLETNDKPWEGRLVEAPTMWKHGSRYVLFYSANAFDTPFYAVGYASCSSPTGPCTDNSKNPVLQSRCKAAGPGHQALFVDAGGHTWIAYHAWNPRDVGDHPGEIGRQLWFDPVQWKKGKPIVHGPTCKRQKAPVASG